MLTARLAFAILCCVSIARSQSGFNVQLRLNYESADETISLYEGRSGNPQYIAGLRGSQIAMATTGLLAQKLLSTADLTSSLEGAKFNNIVGEDVFRMRDARSRVAAIKALVDQCKRRNFGQKVVSTVEQLFPDDARISTTFPVYFVAFGHPNIDAYVRRVVWNGDSPTFVGEGQGELTVVVNLAKAANYAGPVEQQFIELLTVVAHEVFHVAFGIYQDTSPTWRRYFAQHRGYVDDLLELTQNEGIAYYLNLVQHHHGKLPQAWVEQLPYSFSQFNSSVHELLSPRISAQRADELIRASNLSGSHKESYGAFTGMIVARQIDQTFGRDALRQTIALGP
ncbi:MAG: DUF5700 domain-containing putative Zn-dependent protease, partial [Bacteroidota bacterium]